MWQKTLLEPVSNIMNQQSNITINEKVLTLRSLEKIVQFCG